MYQYKKKKKKNNRSYIKSYKYIESIKFKFSAEFWKRLRKNLLKNGDYFYAKPTFSKINLIFWCYSLTNYLKHLKSSPNIYIIISHTWNNFQNKLSLSNGSFYSHKTFFEFCEIFDVKHLILGWNGLLAYGNIRSKHLKRL